MKVLRKLYPTAQSFLVATGVAHAIPTLSLLIAETRKSATTQRKLGLLSLISSTEVHGKLFLLRCSTYS